MTERDVMLLPVQILAPATATNGGLVKFPGGREIILGKTDADALRVADGQTMLEQVFKLSCDAQFDLATKIAANVGYVLVGEPAFDDTRATAAAPVAGRADSIRERGRYYDIIVEALVDYDGWMLDDDYDATPVLNRIMKRMRDRLEMSAPPLPTQPAREEVREAKTDTAQTMLELADRLQQRSSDILEQSGTSQHQIDCAMAAKFLRSPAIGTPDDAREALADFARRCKAYLEDAPMDGRHSDAAGSNAYELIQEAIEHVEPLAAIPREQEVKPVAVMLTDEQEYALERMAGHDLRDPGLGWDDNLLLIQSAAQAAKDVLGSFAAPPSDSPGIGQPQTNDTPETVAEELEYFDAHADFFAEAHKDIVSECAHQPQGGSFTERAIKLIREAAGHQDDWGKYEYAVIDLAREADSAHQPQGGDARCLITGNLVGTDTRPVGQPCNCAACAPPAPVRAELGASQPPEWLWYGEVDGVDIVTFGRWPKGGAKWRYKLADIQPTEHDHPKTSRQTFEEILASLKYDGQDTNSLTVGEIRRAL